MSIKKSIIFQLDAPLKEAADSKLASIGMSMSEYLRRCLTALTEDDSTVQHVTDTLNKLVHDSSKNSKE